MRHPREPRGAALRVAVEHEDRLRLAPRIAVVVHEVVQLAVLRYPVCGHELPSSCVTSSCDRACALANHARFRAQRCAPAPRTPRRQDGCPPRTGTALRWGCGSWRVPAPG